MIQKLRSQSVGVQLDHELDISIFLTDRIQPFPTIVCRINSQQIPRLERLCALRPKHNLKSGIVFGNFRSFQYVEDRKSTRLNSSHVKISYAVFCLKQKKECAHYQIP